MLRSTKYDYLRGHGLKVLNGGRKVSKRIARINIRAVRELRYIGSYQHNMLEQRVGWWKQRATDGLGSKVWSSAQSHRVPKQEELNGFEGSDRLEMLYDICWRSLKLWKWWQQ